MKNVRTKLTHVRPSFRALYTLWREEFSFRLQTTFGAIVLICAIVLRVSHTELLIVILMIGAVLSVEALNTAIEELCDHVTPDQHPQIGKVKDLGSSASALVGTTAIIIGLMIFIPRLLAIL